MTSDSADFAPSIASRPPLVIQILAIIGFTGFAIPVSIIAMDQFGLLGMALAAFLAWQWTRLAGLGSEAHLNTTVSVLKPQTDDLRPSSGNASFKAYRNELLDRLEQEQSSFDAFLNRLRDAKDESEFDTFLVERENSAHAATV